MHAKSMVLSRRVHWLLAGSFLTFACLASGQSADLDFLNHNRSIPDAHNCYPYEGKWADRIERALKSGFPIAIEQDLAWYRDPHSGVGRVVVSHQPKTDGTEPEERNYFFERVRPIIEKELASGDSSHWPIIVLHFDFKDVQPALLHAVWKLLGEYQGWISTAEKTADPHELAPIDRKPLLVLTEDSDAKEKVFYNEVPVGTKLRLFGSAHTHVPQSGSREEQNHMMATLAPEQLLSDKPTDYRRWWNNSWYEVEEGGQPNAGAWTGTDRARLQALVDHAHRMGYWIRFYTLDGFDAQAGRENGWFAGYNFGSLQAAQERWQTAIESGVNLIASDQYEALAAFLHKTEKH